MSVLQRAYSLIAGSYSKMEAAMATYAESENPQDKALASQNADMAKLDIKAVTALLTNMIGTPFESYFMMNKTLGEIGSGFSRAA